MILELTADKIALASMRVGLISLIIAVASLR